MEGLDKEGLPIARFDLKKRRKLLRLAPPQVLALGILLIILAGSFLLNLSYATKSGVSMPYIDALFLSTSAACVTGLSHYNTGADLSLFGQLVILVLVQIGGLGFMTMATLIALVFGKRITFRERLILQEAMNQGTTEGIVRLMRKVLIYALIIETAGALVFTLLWMAEMPPGQAAYFGIYHSVSVFNNAGFDLMGSLEGRPSSMIHYVENPLFNIVTVMLIILGGIGFIVLDDLLNYWRTRRRLSLHSKVVLVFSGSLIVLGTIVIFIFEFSNEGTLHPLTGIGKVFGALFQSVSARSAGVSSLDIAEMRQATQFFLIILMFIGAAPGSAGGGIKVTTFAILLGALYAMFRGRNDIVLFRNRIAKDRIHKAITFTFLTFFVIVLATMILSVTEHFPFLGILFEVTSALATTGLSMGLTSELSPFGQTLIMILMFVGRLGPITLAFTLISNREKELYRHPEGRIIIG